MSYFKTAILLAGLTALFMGVGYLIGGASGAMIALVVAAATNIFAYWNSDKHGAVDVRRPAGRRAQRAGSRPPRGRSGRPCRLPMPHVFVMDEAAAQRVRHRPQSAERRGRGHHRPDADRSAARNSPA